MWILLLPCCVFMQYERNSSPISGYMEVQKCNSRCLRVRTRLQSHPHGYILSIATTSTQFPGTKWSLDGKVSRWHARSAHEAFSRLTAERVCYDGWHSGLLHCLMSTATTHIGSSSACSGDQSRFWSRFGKWFGQSKGVPVSYPKPIIPLFRAVVTVMEKWLYIQQSMAI